MLNLDDIPAAAYIPSGVTPSVKSYFYHSKDYTPNLVRGFDKVICISLEHRVDRQKAFWEEIPKSGWPFKTPEIFKAISLKDVVVPRTWSGYPAAYACAQSHIAVLEQQIKEDGLYLVLEDDVCFADDFKKKVLDFLAVVPNDWEGLMIGGDHNGQPYYEMGIPGVVRCHCTFCMHCYALRGRLLRDLVAASKTANVVTDIVLANMARNYKVYACHPFIAGQSGSLSDLTGETRGRFFGNGGFRR